MCKKSRQQQKYYFSNKLKRQLHQISHHPLIIVEAPSGFGKTTAVREYLKERLPLGACGYWYTCLGESAFMSWMGICELFSNVSDKVADDLKNLKTPTKDTLYYVASYLRDMPCQRETYLVIDNYQLANLDIHQELISVFSMHGNPNLHMIFITQQMKASYQSSIFNHNIHTIGAPSFFFDKEGTANLFRLEGIQLTQEEVENVYQNTEGWVSAIRLQIINYKQNGLLDYNADIERLVETAIWNRLTPEEKDFLLSTSVMESFTLQQAAIMMERETLPANIRELLRSNDFIRYIPDQHQYSIHSILRDYLLNRFYYDQQPDYQKQVFRKAGYACAAVSQYCPAAHFFYKIKDFNAILALPFSCEYFDNYKEKYKPEFIEGLINECPESTMHKYPFTLIVLGYQTYACGQIAVYEKICRILRSIIEKGENFDEGELRRVKGEYALLASMGDFNHRSKLKEGQKTAWELLGQPSQIIKSSTLWGYTTTSVMDILWREPGKLEYTLQQMDEMSDLYRKLTQGQGAGARNIMKAEAMLMRGEDDEAEILCHKGLYDARNFQQISICLCGELILARIAILRGDEKGYFAAIRNIQDYTKENPKLYVLRIVEQCMSVISLLLDTEDYVAPWLYDMESIKKVLPAPAVPSAQMLHLKLLLMDKRYNEFYGICQILMDGAENLTANVKYMMPRVHRLILLAMAKWNKGKHLEAREHLRQALDIALPDQVYLPFAQQEGMEDLLSEISNDFDFLRELCRRQQRGVRIIRKAILQNKSPLTPREREIALLARDRLSAKEIADKLYISEMTVRSTLRNVYSKLGIHSKSELKAKEF